MPTKHDYELASARYMCMREEGLLSQLSEAQYLDNLKMIGITWHGPRDPTAELGTVRQCEPSGSTPLDEYYDHEIQRIIDARHAVAEAHCKANGWNLEHLTVAQMLEIRALPEWKDAGR
jgi:hypothetical protein